MSQTKPNVSVVIVNWNGKRFLKPCLDSLFKTSYADYDVYLVDNASTDGSADFAKQSYSGEIGLGRLKLVENDKNHGFAEGNNIGIRRALGNRETNYIAALNADTVVEPDWLGKLVAAMDGDRGVGMCQGKILLMDRKTIDSTGILFYRSATWWDRGENERDAGRYSKGEVFGVTAAAALYRREMLQDIAVGGEFFDGDFFGYCEDIDLSLRGRLRGWRAVYEPRAVAYHHRGGTTGPQTPFQVYHTQRNNLLLIFKSIPTGFALRNLPLIMAAQLGSASVYVRRRRSRIFLTAKLGAVRMLGRMLAKRKSVMKGVKQDLGRMVEMALLPPLSAVPSSP